MIRTFFICWEYVLIFDIIMSDLVIQYYSRGDAPRISGKMVGLDFLLFSETGDMLNNF